jgi:adenosine deaminase
MLTEEWLHRIPKVELHLHLEGSIRPALLRKLAAKNSIPLPPLDAAIPSEEPAYRYGSFLEFLDCFKTACSVLLSPDDVALAADALFDDLIHQNILYAEIFISPVIHERKGISTVATMRLIRELADHKRRTHGFRCQFLFDAVRQWGVESCAYNAELAEVCLDFGVAGIGIGGDESALPAVAFSQIYRRAKAAGLRLTAHAGEYAGPASVWDAILHLQPERIGHGIRAAEDPLLLEEIRNRGITLDIGLTSNLRTGVCSSLQDHPVQKINAAGIPFTLNTDDPALFSTTLGHELMIGSSLLDLESTAVGDLMMNALNASFLRPEEKARLAVGLRTEIQRGQSRTP